MALTLPRSLINWSSMPTGRTDDWHQYIASIKPTYDHLIRLAGQVSGMLILPDIESRLRAALQMYRPLGVQVSELIGELQKIKPPTAGQSHYAHLAIGAHKLCDVIHELEFNLTKKIDVTQENGRYDGLTRCLQMLKCVSDPWSGLQPVKFDGCCACCID